jgi:hypothetical protein
MNGAAIAAGSKIARVRVQRLDAGDIAHFRELFDVRGRPLDEYVAGHCPGLTSKTSRSRSTRSSYGSEWIVSKPSNLPATFTPGIAFTYNETEVAFDERRLVNATQMWRAVGSPPNKRFADWRRRVGASFIRDLVKDRGVAIRHLIRVSRKKGTAPGAKWAH